MEWIYGWRSWYFWILFYEKITIPLIKFEKLTNDLNVIFSKEIFCFNIFKIIFISNTNFIN
jgi:hypothetical protein